MKLSVEFPSVSYREGPAAVASLARAIERIGYAHIDIFDHVVMGVPIEGRPRGPYNAQMPILEALMALAYMAAVTTRVSLGTEVLVLPQRQPTLVAKQVSTLDTLSGGRVRLGVGVGWQESEYEALGESFHDRGARMDEAIRLLRAYWTDAEVNMASAHYPTVSMAMGPQPRAGAAPAGSGAASPPRPARGRPSRPSIATRRRPAAIREPSGSRAWWLPRPATRRARRSTGTTTRWWPGWPRSRRWASAGSRSTPPRSSRPARAPSTR